ncbi:MAG: hypothetical protein K6G83_00640 [Lachnospiraceae bacterium]|nr:hypothetical protein [Lachnospiraceae bacterium]
MKKYSVKQEMLATVIVPMVVLTAVMLLTGIWFMKAGMEKEILKGLLAAAYEYKDIAVLHTDRWVGDNDLEDELKRKSGYDFTWFDVEVRKNSSLGESAIGTRAAETVMKEVIGSGKDFYFDRYDGCRNTFLCSLCSCDG